MTATIKGDLSPAVDTLAKRLPEHGAGGGDGLERYLPGAEGESTADLDINLPPEFWDERPVLTHIRDAAYATLQSADALFGVCLTRIAALTPPSVLLPNPVATHGTLDFATALIGESGGGKTSAMRRGRDVLPIEDPDVLVAPLGSGEGIVEAYMGTIEVVGEDGKTREERAQVRRSYLATADEGEAMAELGGRRGSVVLQTIRTAWSGDQLGQQNASKERTRRLDAGGYRFAFLCGFQVATAHELLADVHGGTPQRFLFVAAEDVNIPDEPARDPGPLFISPPTGRVVMSLDPDATKEIRSRALAARRRQVILDPLDAHQELLRLKVAGLLAIVEGRTHINADDWRLAGVVTETSRRVRGRVIDVHAAMTEQDQRRRNASAASRELHVDRVVEEEALWKMAATIGRHVHRHGVDCKRRCCTQATAGKNRERASFDDALHMAVAEEWIVADGDIYRPGPVTPPGPGGRA